MTDFFATVRCDRIRRFADLAAATNHARGLDETCKDRMMKDGPRAVAWSRLTDDFQHTEVGEESHSTDLVAAFRDHKKAHGAVERKGAAFALHLLVIVSPSWLNEAPDSKTEREGALIRQAVDWANSSLGEDSVFAARYDLNERGEAVVDIFVAPVREQRIGRGRKLRKMIAPNAALNEIGARHGQTRTYAALQDSWAEHARKHLDPRLRRGTPKRISGATHLTPEAYRAKVREAQAVEAAEQAEAEQEAVERRTRQVREEAERGIAIHRERARKAEHAEAEAETQRALAERELAKARAKTKRALAEKAQAEQDNREAQAVSKKAKTVIDSLTDQLVGLRIERDQLAAERDHLTEANGTLAADNKTMKAENSTLRRAGKKAKDAAASLRSGAEAWRTLWDIVHEEGAVISRALIRPAFDLVRKTILPAVRRAAAHHGIDLEREQGRDGLPEWQR